MIKILEMESSKGWGGQEKRTVRLVNSLDKKKFKVFWAVQEGSTLYKNKDVIDADFHLIPMRQSFDIVGLIKIIMLIRKYKIDIISTHSGKDAWIGSLAGLFTHTKVVRTRHLQTPINSVTSYNLSSKVITVSNQVKKYLEDVGVKKEKLHTIYTGIDTNLYQPDDYKFLNSELQISRDTIIIGIVAVLRQAKRHVDLIDAFMKINSSKPIVLVIIGNGPHEDFLKNHANILGKQKMKKIYFLGHREDIPKILPSIDIFVLPSNMEALGTAILEASSCAIPCIGSNIGGIPECIVNGETGYLFECENTEELSEKLNILIDNEEERKKLGLNARKFIQNNFSIEAMTAKTEDMYQELIL